MRYWETWGRQRRNRRKRGQTQEANPEGVAANLARYDPLPIPVKNGCKQAAQGIREKRNRHSLAAPAVAAANWTKGRQTGKLVALTQTHTHTHLQLAVESHSNICINLPHLCSRISFWGMETESALRRIGNDKKKPSTTINTTTTTAIASTTVPSWEGRFFKRWRRSTAGSCIAKLVVS